MGKYNVSTKDRVLYIINLIIATINMGVIIFYQNVSNKQVLIPILLILTSLVLVYRVRKSKSLFFLISVIAYVNISIAVLDGFFGGGFSSEYQYPLRNSLYNIIYLKSLLLNITLILLSLGPRTILKASQVKNSVKEINRKKNSIIAIVGVVLIAVFMVLGFESGNADTFRASVNPLYEYVILLFIITWFFSDGLKIVEWMLGIMLFYYILNGILMGDRSSSLVMLVLIGMMIIEKINVTKFMLYGIGGVLLANGIAVYRNLTKFDLIYILENILSNGLVSIFSDTASASYYSGVVIISIKELVNASKLEYILKFIISIFLGSSFPGLREGNVTLVASDFTHVGGGGVYSSYFYFWGGYLGVIIGALILVIIIKKVYTSNSTHNILLQYYMTTMAFRWYLYTPFTLFRTTILMFFIVYGLSNAFHKLLFKEKIKKYNN